MASFEVGPGVLRPDGTVFYTGANGCGAAHTAIYHSDTGLVDGGPGFSGLFRYRRRACGTGAKRQGSYDGKPIDFSNPVDVLRMGRIHPDGNSPAPLCIERLIVLRQHASPSNRPDSLQVTSSSSRFTILREPTIRPGHQGSSLPLKGRAPVGLYVISGHRFNGMSQGAAYGDDQQSATNYPLVRITNNATGHVFYSRTHDHSSMAVAFNGRVSTHFDVPATQEPGPSQLVVVANGILSPSRCRYRGVKPNR